MSEHPISLNPLDQDPADLTARIMNIESVSGNEKALADAVEAALSSFPHLSVERDGDAVVARTTLGRPRRVILAGHLDTVPLPTVPGSRGTVPAQVEGDLLYGRGATDMKGGVAVQLALAAELAEPVHDVTYVFYDHEEVEAELNGLGRLSRNRPELLEGDFAVLLEPTDGFVEGGCNGTLRIAASTRGLAAHSARAWRGRNAVHQLAEALVRLRDHEAATVVVDGLAYRESLGAVGVSGGVAGNVVPDRAEVVVNYRFAPDKTVEEAARVVEELLEGYECRLTDSSPGARPGLDHPDVAAFIEAVGTEPRPKYGWTDVARFSELGIPAVNFGPGDPMLAHSDDEHVSREQIRQSRDALRTWLRG